MRIYLLIALLAGLPVFAAGASETGIDWLDWATEQVAFTMREAEPVAPGEVVARPLPPVDPLAATHSIESIEIHRLQQEIHLLRQLIENEFVGRIISLEAELREVRAALQTQRPGGRPSGPIIPRPDDVDPYYAPPPASEFSQEPAMAAEADLPAPSEAPLPPPAAFSFTVVDEWGRSPEAAAEIGGDTPTLIGIAGVVPPRSAQADVEALLQELRAEYDAYDNINIEVFDTEAAARAFAERQYADPNHHVASISRHKSTGRDVLLYLGGEDAEALPLADAGG